jgi:signal transduction histidine kinase
MLKPKLNFEFDSKKYFKLSEVPISFQSSIERSESLTDWKNLLIIILLGMVGLTLGTYYIYKELKRPLKKTDSIIAFIAKNPSGKYESKLPRDSQFKRLADSLLSLHEDRKKLEKENIALESEKVLSQMASQVAHDIRSPLVALKVVASDSKKLSEKQRTIIRNATTRIYDIAENLLSETKIKLPVAKQSVDRHMLAALISSLVSEKRTQHSGVHGLEINEIFSNSCYGVFVQVNQRELKRVLSNLINNSVEALDGPGLVEVSVNVQPNFAEVVVSDNGPGIPASLQEKVERKGVSFGKPDGSGLGLYHAKNTVEGWGGELKIDSSEEGTSVHISLPRTFAPKWFLSKIDVRNARAIVVLDDDKNIHLFWDKSYVDLGLKDKGVGLYHFTDPVECKKWLIEQPDKRQFKFLFDYELIGHHVTGLDLIEEFGLAQNAVLVTSHDEVAEVLDRCARLNVSLLPKTLAHLVPIEVDS